MQVQREGFNTAALVLFKGKQASVKVSILASVQDVSVMNGKCSIVFLVPLGSPWPWPLCWDPRRQPSPSFPWHLDERVVDFIREFRKILGRCVMDDEWRKKVEKNFFLLLFVFLFVFCCLKVTFPVASLLRSKKATMPKFLIAHKS